MRVENKIIFFVCVDRECIVKRRKIKQVVLLLATLSFASVNVSYEFHVYKTIYNSFILF